MRSCPCRGGFTPPSWATLAFVGAGLAPPSWVALAFVAAAVRGGRLSPVAQPLLAGLFALFLNLYGAQFDAGCFATKNTKGRRLAPPALRFFEAFSRSRRNYVPRPTPLAGTHGRTRRRLSWAESHSRHQRWRHVAQRLPARGAMVGAVGFSPHPIPLHFTSWIDTLNSGARHHGHSELPQRPPTHSLQVNFPWRPEIRRKDRADLQIFPPCTWGVNRKPPQPLVISKEICGKTLHTRNIRCPLLSA